MAGFHWLQTCARDIGAVFTVTRICMDCLLTWLCDSPGPAGSLPTSLPRVFLPENISNRFAVSLLHRRARSISTLFLFVKGYLTTHRRRPCSQPIGRPACIFTPLQFTFSHLRMTTNSWWNQGGFLICRPAEAPGWCHAITNRHNSSKNSG